MNFHLDAVTPLDRSSEEPSTFDLRLVRSLTRCNLEKSPHNQIGKLTEGLSKPVAVAIAARHALRLLTHAVRAERVFAMPVVGLGIDLFKAILILRLAAGLHERELADATGLASDMANAAAARYPYSVIGAGPIKTMACSAGQAAVELAMSDDEMDRRKIFSSILNDFDTNFGLLSDGDKKITLQCIEIDCQKSIEIGERIRHSPLWHHRQTPSIAKSIHYGQHFERQVPEWFVRWYELRLAGNEKEWGLPEAQDEKLCARLIENENRIWEKDYTGFVEQITAWMAESLLESAPVLIKRSLIAVSNSTGDEYFSTLLVQLAALRSAAGLGKVAQHSEVSKNPRAVIGGNGPPDSLDAEADLVVSEILYGEHQTIAYAFNRHLAAVEAAAAACSSVRLAEQGGILLRIWLRLPEEFRKSFVEKSGEMAAEKLFNLPGALIKWGGGYGLLLLIVLKALAW